MKVSEANVVRSCVDLLKIKRIIFWKNHVINGKIKGSGEKSFRHIITGTAGMGDLSFMLNDGSGRIAFIEFKSPTGKQSQVQIDFEKECIKRNVLYFVVRDPADLQEILEMFGM